MLPRPGPDRPDAAAAAAGEGAAGAKGAYKTAAAAERVARELLALPRRRSGWRRGGGAYAGPAAPAARAGPIDLENRAVIPFHLPASADSSTPDPE